LGIKSIAIAIASTKDKLLTLALLLVVVKLLLICLTTSSGLWQITYSNTLRVNTGGLALLLAFKPVLIAFLPSIPKTAAVTN
jgi:hypothetical protein